VALAGAFICWFFIADLTGLDLAEQVRLRLHCTGTQVGGGGGACACLQLGVYIKALQ
jgi:hypothetical protein